MTQGQRRPDRVLGEPHDAFWAWCARGELRLQRCAACEQIAWPPVRACERCGGGAFSWDRMSGRATLVSWCQFARDYYRGAIPLPYDCILVALEEGPVFVSDPDGIGYDELTEGMALEVRFLPCEDSNGPFQLPVFGPPTKP